MAQVTLENVTKRFDSVVAVKDVNLTIDDKEFVVLVGPSGCGKSTTLRMVAGLEEISGGTIKIGDRVVNDVPPKDRDIAMVFQNYALYPHMSVYDNMAFGLKLRKFPKPEIEQRVKEAAEILGIQELLQRKPRALSGGQRQRVAVGRAIVRKPQVFLFDEPLSNLDAKLRVAMRAELKKLHDRLQSTVIYVTHDQVEAMTMGDRIVIMKDGLIQQVGAPLEVYASPQNQFVAGFIGSPAMNFLPCTVMPKGDGLAFTAPGLSLPVPPAKAKALAEFANRKVTMGIRPEDMREALPTDPAQCTFEASVEVVEPIGHEIYLNVMIDGTEVVARVSPDTPVKVGQKIKLAATVEKLHAFDPQTEKSIGL
ncbi:MAG: sn-glycerol-3-phosphate ABC transporter ATP-binding protein UgpC [Candidatus Methylomirabilota bacterium]